MSKRFLSYIVVGLLFASELFAIKPLYSYRVTPKSFNIKYNEYLISSIDNYKINIWQIPSTKATKGTIVISYGDSGNMGEWCSLGIALCNEGYDVWMYDYRGFGKSSPFNIDNKKLYYTEFVIDLETVIKFIDQQDAVYPIMLLGLSMGTIVNDLLLQRNYNNRNISGVVCDGYIVNVNTTLKRLQELGKCVSLPDYSTIDTNRKIRKIPRLIIQASEDILCLKEDYKNIKKSKNVIYKEFKCNHINSFFKYPSEYITSIDSLWTKINVTH